MNKSKNLLVTGGAGFIGSNFISLLLKEANYHITNVDLVTYAGNYSNMKEFEKYPNYRFIQANISNKEEIAKCIDQTYDVIVNFAAESHVDRSINNALPFIETNIKGTLNLLNIVLSEKAKKMIQISTDEVYGALTPDAAPFTEKTPLTPSNPYAASKAGADLLVQSFYRTYQLPLIITRCSNNYGPKQHTEKFIPKIITNALQNKKIPLFGDGHHIREWIHVEDHCRAVLAVLEKGKNGEIYNIGGGTEKANRELVAGILNMLGKPNELLQFIPDRLGHDERYAMNCDKIRKELGWKRKILFKKGIANTIKWYKEKHEETDGRC